MSNKMRNAMQNMHSLREQVLQLWSNPPQSRKERLALLEKSFDLLGIPQSQWPVSVGKAKQLGDMEILSISNIWYVADVNLIEITYVCQKPYGEKHQTKKQKKRYSIGDTVLVIPLIKTSQGFQTALRQTHRAADGLQTDFPRGFMVMDERGSFPKYNPDSGTETRLSDEEAVIEILHRNMPGLLEQTTNAKVIQVAVPGREDNSASPQNVWVYIYYCETADTLNEGDLRKVLRETHPHTPVKSTKILSLQKMDAIFSSYVSGFDRIPFKAGWLNSDHDKAARFMATEWLEKLAEYTKPPWKELKKTLN